MKIMFCILSLALLLQARPIDLYYTEDGRKVQSIRGYEIRSDFSLPDQAEESWLVLVGQKIGPNGYSGKDSKISIGTLGKSKAVFNVSTGQFLGFGHARTQETNIGLEDILYLLPDSVPFAPIHVMLQNGQEGDLFVGGEYTESTGAKQIADKMDNSLFVIQLKYDVPRSRRTQATRPQQYGIRAKAVAFTESGLRKAMQVLSSN